MPLAAASCPRRGKPIHPLRGLGQGLGDVQRAAGHARPHGRGAAGAGGAACCVPIHHLVEDRHGQPQPPASQVSAALAESTDAGWVEVTRRCADAQAVDAVTHSPAEALPACTRLVDDAESSGDLGLLAAALGMRAELAIRDGDVVGFGRDASRGVVLLDEDGDPLARVSGMISVAVAYEALNLWELGDELYTRAEELLPLCDAPLRRRSSG